MLSFLQKPHPFIFNRMSVVIPAVITLVVLLLLRPFEFRQFDLLSLIGWSVAFSILVAATVFFSVTLVKRFFHNSIEEKWTVGKEVFLVLFVLFCINVVIFLLFLFLNQEVNILQLFSLVVMRTMAISLIPVLVLVLFEQIHHQSIKRLEAEHLCQTLQAQKVNMQFPNMEADEKVVLKSQNQKIALRRASKDIYYMRSFGNYLEVYYSQNGEMQKELIRNSLKAIEEQVPQADFFRCHKSYVVNLQHLTKVEGNARNLELILDGVDEKIPVSRSKSAHLWEKFQ